jgi:hypothetical protein
MQSRSLCIVNADEAHIEEQTDKILLGEVSFKTKLFGQLRGDKSIVNQLIDDLIILMRIFQLKQTPDFSIITGNIEINELLRILTFAARS